MGNGRKILWKAVFFFFWPLFLFAEYRFECLLPLQKLLNRNSGIDQVIAVDFTSPTARVLRKENSPHPSRHMLRVQRTAISQDIGVWDEPIENIRNFLGLNPSVSVRVKDLNVGLGRAVDEVERMLPIDGHIMLIAQQQRAGRMTPIGILRLFISSQDSTASRSPLPLELILTRMKHSFSVEKSLGLSIAPDLIAEIGKFWIDPSLPASQRKAVKKSLLKLLLECLALKEAEFKKSFWLFAHAGTSAHQRLYEREYGLKTLSRFDEGDVVMGINSSDMIQRLRKLSGE